MTTWSVSTLNDTVTQELEKLPVDMRARFTKVSELIEKFGPQNVGMPHSQKTPKKELDIARKRAKEAGLI